MSVCVYVKRLYICLLLGGNLNIVKILFFKIVLINLVEFWFKRNSGIFWGETWEKLIWQKYVFE